MCLAVPGKIVSVSRSDEDPLTGTLAAVDFQGSRVEVCLAMTPEADVGDWVLVHAGFALAVLEEADARQTWEYLNTAGLGDVPEELRGEGSARPAAAGEATAGEAAGGEAAAGE